jgi:hypothetical protein
VCVSYRNARAKDDHFAIDIGQVIDPKEIYGVE